MVHTKLLNYYFYDIYLCYKIDLYLCHKFDLI